VRTLATRDSMCDKPEVVNVALAAKTSHELPLAIQSPRDTLTAVVDGEPGMGAVITCSGAWASWMCSAEDDGRPMFMGESRTRILSLMKVRVRLDGCHRWTCPRRMCCLAD
jgi:hypothetical protein